MWGSQRLGEVWWDLTGTRTLVKWKESPRNSAGKEKKPTFPMRPASWTGPLWPCCGDWDRNKSPPFPALIESLHSPRMSSGLASSEWPSLVVPTLTAHPSLLHAMPTH